MSHFWRLTLAVTLAGLVTGAAFSQEARSAPRGLKVLSARPSSITIAYSQYLWPKVNGVATVYYQIDAASDPNATQKITNAIDTFNTDFPNIIQWVLLPQNSSANYVDINLSASDTSGVCEANEGYEAIQAQPMTGSTDCTEGTILHEMGHVIGFWHEQSRPDRASYITLNYSNVIKGSWSNFLPATDDQQILGPYDYASVMQYIPYAFSANGRPVIESIPAGIPLSGYAGVPSLETSSPAQPAYDYSAGDKEAIERLYGATPTKITVTSNPVGLTVIVDGVAVATPQSYSWPLYSTHTLDVPANVQTLSGATLNSDPVNHPQDADTTYYYTYGRWNDSTAQAHTIQVVPGNGSLPFPTTAPQLATYSANFIQLVPYTSTISPVSSGTVSVSPQPQSYSGESSQFFVARQLVTLTASPTPGWNFYEFNNSPGWLPGGLGANPKTINVPDTGNPVNTTVEFSNKPVYTVDVTPETYSANMGVTVDGTNFVYTPKNFSAFPGYDPTWTVNSQHSLSIAPVQAAYSFNSQFNFLSWSDGGAISHSVNIPGVNHKYIATVTREYQPATNFSFPPCGGTASVTPASADNGFYPYGQQLTFNATADPGWTFAGWTYDLTGKSDPATLAADGETLVYANFNTVAAPLTLTALSPASVAVGNAAFTLTLVGTGFAPSSFVVINGQLRSFNYINSARLQVPMTAADAKTLGASQVYVENFPSGWTGCAIFAYQTFLVRGRGATAPTPVFSPKAGAYASTQNVTINDSLISPAPSIYYTTDGSLPTTSSTPYTGAVAISATTTLKAAAYATGYTRSATALATYTIETLTASPTLSLPAGSYSAPQTLQITDAKSPGAIINYTTDGSTPTASSPQYNGPITISSTETVKANAIASGHLRSFIASASYAIN